MRRFRAPMLVGVVLISGMAQHTEAQAVVFNEVLAVNDTVLADEAGEFDDWVELYNGDEEDVDLTGYFLTDNLTVPAQWQLDGIVVPAGGYVVLWLDDQPEQGNHHAPFRLDGAGERLGLFAPDGETAIDTLSFPIQAPDRSFGRQPDGGASWLYFLTPTPNAPNTTAGQTLTASAEPDWVAGLYSGGVTVSFESPSRDAVVHYTLDGTVPDASSPVLDAPLVIDQTTAVRTVAYAPDQLPSRVATHTYLIDEYNTLPKLSLVTDPANLYSSETGIFSDAIQDTSCTVRCENYWQDWERDVHAEYFEAGGERIFGFDMGIKVSGFFSRPDSKKSMGLRTRSRYGTSVIDVPLFDQETFTDRYDGLQVRASRFARSRNEVFFVLNERAGRHLDMQAFRPSHIFLNGAYHGIYNVMERKDEYYAFVHYGEDDVDLIDGVEGLKTGDFVHYNQTVEYLGSEAFRTEEGFRYAAEALVDMESMVEHYATNVIYGRPDYGNIRMWRPRTPDGRWRFLAFDFDLSYPEDDTMARMLNGSRPGELHNMLETLLESPPFKRAFLTRFSDLLNTVYEPETHIAVIDSVADAIEPEMGREIERWISRYETYMPNVRTWTYFIRERRDFAEKRPDRVRQHVRDALNLGAQVELVLEVDVSDADAGSISVNGLKVGASPWTGLYFPGLPVTLSAEPQPGYRFAGWSGEDVPDEPTVTVTMSRARSLTARFTKSVTPPRLVVTEINYHPWPVLDAGDWVELHSLSADTVALDGWRLVDQSGNEAELIGTVEPSGYVVLCREPEAFERVYAFSCTSTFDYSLGNGGDALTLFAPDGQTVDAIAFEDRGDWPREPDGAGHTLSLQDPTLDNAEAEHWRPSNALAGTPGRPNEVEPAPAIVLNEIQYHASDGFDTGDWVELYNPNLDQLDLSAWGFSDADTLYILPDDVEIAPNGYLVLCRNPEDFLAAYGFECLGSFEFGIDNGGTTLKLWNPDRAVSDSLTFDDREPWPVEADGEGATLELLVSTSDNALSTSWRASLVQGGTPGAGNSVSVGADAALDVPARTGIASVYPNPFRQNATVELHVAETTEIELRVYDLLGRLVGRLDPGVLPAGRHQLEWTPRGLSASEYFVQLLAAGRIVETRPIVRIR